MERMSRISSYFTFCLLLERECLRGVKNTQTEFVKRNDATSIRIY